LLSGGLIEDRFAVSLHLGCGIWEMEIKSWSIPHSNRSLVLDCLYCILTNDLLKIVEAKKKYICIYNMKII